MCGPAALPVLAFAVTTAATVASYDAQQQAARSQRDFNAAELLAGSISSRSEFDTNNQQVLNLEQQRNEAAAQQAQQVSKQAARARATAKVASAEAGVSGNSVDALLDDFTAQEQDALGVLTRNRELEAAQAGLTLRGIRTTGINQISSLRRAPVTGPSALTSALQITGAGLGARGQYLESIRQVK